MTVKNKSILALSAISLITYYFESLAWPLHLGRDGLNYIIYFIDILAKKPVYQLLMLRRTPMAPVLYGVSLTLWGSVVTEILSAVFYCISIILLYRLASHFGTKTGMAVALLVNFYPAYGSLYHVVASEPPATFFLIFWCALFFDTMGKPQIKKFALLGLICFLATMSRPDSVVLSSLAICPLLFLASPLKERVRYSAAMLGMTLCLIILWSTYNYIRYDDFTIARGEKAQMPLERAFTISHIVREENGPASANLARLVSTQLLTKEPYVSYGINTEIFFSQGKERMFWDLIPLSDQYYGWDSDYAQLRKVGIEAVMANPRIYFWDYLKSAGGMLLFNPEWPVALRKISIDLAPRLDERGLPIPTEEEQIPHSYFWASSSSPDGRALPDPNSITTLILNPIIQHQTDELQNKLAAYEMILPNRDGIALVANFLNTISLLYPPPIFWLLCGVIGLFLFPTRQKTLMAMILGAIVIIIFYPMLGFGSIFIMRARFDPLIILFGVKGFLEIIRHFIQKSKYGRGHYLPE